MYIYKYYLKVVFLSFLWEFDIIECVRPWARATQHFIKRAHISKQAEGTVDVKNILCQ